MVVNNAQKNDLFFPFFIKVVVNKSKAYSFLIIARMHLQKNISFSYNAAIPFFFSLLRRALEYINTTEVLCNFPNEVFPIEKKV